MVRVRVPERRLVVQGFPGGRIVEDAQLRPENVLFLDDLAINRAEVGHFVPGIQTAGPEILDRLLDLPQLTGKDDRSAVQVAAVPAAGAEVGGPPDGSGVQRGLPPVLRHPGGRAPRHRAQADRLFELSERTNQLNFTKRRQGREAFDAMIADPGYDTGYVRVTDRYGDYGICGFYSVSRSDGALVDFLFSCRVLNMGVEQWLYRRLGSPPLSVVGEVVSSLDGESGWITEDGSGPSRASSTMPVVTPGIGQGQTGS